MIKKNDVKFKIALLNDSDIFFSSVVRSIEGAKKTLDLAYFIIHNDYMANIFLGLIYQAANRGVRVRLILDGLGEGVSLSHTTKMLLNQHENIEIRLYNKLSFSSFLKINNRIHLKLLVADSETIISGGRNIGGIFFGMKSRSSVSRYLDNDLYIKNKEISKSVLIFFDEIWNNKLNIEIKKLNRRWWWVNSDRAKKYINKRKRRLLWSVSLARKKHREWFKDLDLNYFEISDMEVVCDINHKCNINRTAKFIYSEFSKAKRSIYMRSPYFIPTKKILKILKYKNLENIKIDLLTNSVLSTENIFAMSGHQRYKKDYKDFNISHWEYYGKKNLHYKNYIIDDSTVIMGSFNLDPRSEKLNLELIFSIKDSGFAKEVLRKDYLLKKDSCLKKDVLCVNKKTKKFNIFFWKKSLVYILKIFSPLWKNIL